jgi:hypothetical protein
MSTPLENSSVYNRSSFLALRIVLAAVIFCLSIVYAIVGVASAFMMESTEYVPYMVLSLVPGFLPCCFCTDKSGNAFDIAAAVAVAWMLGLEFFVGVFFT